MKDRALAAQFTIILISLCNVIIDNYLSLISLAIWIWIFVDTYNEKDKN